jgi:hypothetical protein
MAVLRVAFTFVMLSCCGKLQVQSSSSSSSSSSLIWNRSR